MNWLLKAGWHLLLLHSAKHRQIVPSANDSPFVKDVAAISCFITTSCFCILRSPPFSMVSLAQLGYSRSQRTFVISQLNPDRK